MYTTILINFFSLKTVSQKSFHMHTHRFTSFFLMAPEQGCIIIYLTRLLLSDNYLACDFSPSQSRSRGTPCLYILAYSWEFFCGRDSQKRNCWVGVKPFPFCDFLRARQFGTQVYIVSGLRTKELELRACGSGFAQLGVPPCILQLQLFSFILQAHCLQIDSSRGKRNQVLLCHSSNIQRKLIFHMGCSQARDVPAQKSPRQTITTTTCNNQTQPNLRYFISECNSSSG